MESSPAREYFIFADFREISAPVGQEEPQALRFRAAQPRADGLKLGAGEFPPQNGDTAMVCSAALFKNAIKTAAIAASRMQIAINALFIVRFFQRVFF